MGGHGSDPRAWVDARIQNNQFTYSLLQLRLVGVVLMLIVVARLVVFLFAGLHVSPLEQLAALGGLANWLPLLPLAISLYLLGAGRHRLPRERHLLVLVHHSLLPLSLLALLVLPATILHNLKVLAGIKVATLSFYQQELLSPLRNGTAMALCLIAGVGLLLLKRQGDVEMKRHRLTPALFFQDSTPRLSRHKRRRAEPST